MGMLPSQMFSRHGKKPPHLQKKSKQQRFVDFLHFQHLPTDPTPKKSKASQVDPTTIAMTDEAPDGADDVEAGSAGPHAWWPCSPSLVIFPIFSGEKW